jgi:hypothetical protein
MTNTSNTISQLQSILKGLETEVFYKMETVEILACIIDEHDHTIDEEDTDSLIEALDVIEDGIGGDFTLEFDGNEYRVICDDCIWGSYRDEIQQIVEDCYELNLDKLPAFIAVKIDWEETAQNAYADGYGHTFSGYDGSEYEAGNHWIFRTN